MRRINWIGCIFVAGLGGCSLYPIPDDVSPFSTENIVRYGRCEMRDAILAYMVKNRIIPFPFTEDGIRKQIKATQKLKDNKKTLSHEQEQLLRLAKVAVVYSFDFNITENNKASAGAGFRLPWSTNVLDVGATGALDLTRQGSRVFGTGDNWDELITNSSLCDNYPWERPANIVYPLTGSMGVRLNGSIGVGRVVETFIDIDEQGGAKDNFVDTLTFTTSVSGDANASVKLDPVPNQFRLVSATADAGASRLDIHKLTISLAFPQEDPPSQGGIAGVTRVDGDLNAPFTRPAPWRARYNLCVQDARTRENAFKLLRLEAPEVYCIRYADAFSPQTGFRAEQAQSVLRVEVQGAAPRSSSPPPAAGGAGPPASGGGGDTLAPPRRRIIEPQIRGNAPL
jgi:hypothetical protein